MKESDIRKYAGLMQELGLTGLEITEDNKVVRLERNLPTQSNVVREVVSAGTDLPGMTGAGQSTMAGAGQAGMAAVAGSAAGSVGSQAATNNDCISIKSPIVGVFYAAPAENADPFVSIGDKVEAGKTLCIIEAMKLMNEIPADEGGVIEAICVTNGQMVEYGTELFRIRRV